MAEWVDTDTGATVTDEEFKPKPRAKRGATKKEEGPLPEETYPGPVEEPPVLIDNAEYLKIMEAAQEIFSEDMSPAEKARLENEIDHLSEELDEKDREPRGRVQPGLIEKLSAVMAAIDAVEKQGRNEAQKYDYVRATDVTREVRREFIKHGVVMTTSTKNLKTTIIARDGRAPSILAEIDVDFRVTDGMEQIDFSGVGVGLDTGDKGVYKAITGALKYGLRTLLLLPDEKDDPEVPRPDEYQQPEGGNQITITSAPQQNVIQGGRQQNATSAQIDAIKRVARERTLSAETLTAFIVSTLGEGPSIDPGDSENEMAAKTIAYLSGLSFADCGKIVKGLMEATPNGGA